MIENHADNIYRSKKNEPFVFYPAGKNQYITLLVKTEQRDLAEMQKYLQIAIWHAVGRPEQRLNDNHCKEMF